MSLLTPEEFAFVVRRTPLISIDLIVRNRRAEMLLGLRRNRPAQGFWFVPGSSIRKNESLAQAFQRVTRSELGRELPIGAARLRGVFEHFYDDNFSGDPTFGTHYVVLAYELPIDADALQLPSDQHRDYVWLSDAEVLARADVHPNTKAYAAPAGGS